MTADRDRLEDTLDAASLSRVRAAIARTTGADATLRPEDVGPSSASVAPSAATPPDLASGVDLRETIGEGGMGIVRTGVQRALGREVAVKTLKPTARTASTTRKLLREAWITGALEHPNVVPVHDVTLDADGHPQIVLKKIAGDAWSALMHDPARIRARVAARDPFEWNVRVLMQVCNAVEYAHARGILHRDLKPENVMIGEHGEVYVLDWGIAVSLVDDGSGRIPLASDVDGIAGTPLYMAPEMLDGRGDVLSTRTDVYLLGAMLFEIVAGHAPHAAEGLMETFHRIACVEPALPEGTSEELTALVRRAMAREPRDRFESADALRQALSDHLEHRGSLELGGRADQRLAELERERATPTEDREGWRLRVYHLFGECRFGYLEALRRWPENERAHRGLRRALTLMIELELEGGDPRAAGLLLGELDAPPPELAAQVAQAREARDAEDARLAAIARDQDPTIGRRTRTFLVGVLGTLWTLSPLVLWLLDTDHSELTHPRMLGVMIVMIAIAIALGVWARDSLSRTAMNRSLAAAVGVAVLSQTLLVGMCMAFGVAPVTTLALIAFDHAAVTTMVTTMTARGLWPTSLAYWTAVALATLAPGYTQIWVGLANLVMTVNGVSLWGRLEDVDLRAIRDRRQHRRQEFLAFLERQRTRRSGAPGPGA